MKLRKYQEEARQAVHEQWETVDKTLLVLPTGCHARGERLLMADGTTKAVEEMGGELISVLPRDGAVQTAESQGKTVIEALPESPMAECYRQLAKKVLEVCAEDALLLRA